MDMFELFGSVEELEENVKGVPEWGELPEEQDVQQPSAVPDVQQPWAAPDVQELSAALEVWQPSAAPVMQRCFCSGAHRSTAVIAYLDYNMVYCKDWEADPVIYEFAHSKDAVDFYVKQMERYLSDKKVKVQKGQEALLAASVRKWTGEREE